ncbi:preprotein translocase subunit SecE [candidate division WWE3 bacterium]|jgi:preprotein translocase subunit SecE|nr:preprotein translocase subunit SecE [candidate division WWE3 bacterium]MBT7350774.1 preprotein translocase subunit SecE [candidate division WWE3 bacterium]
MKKIVNFIKESIAEFKKVQWPTKKQTVRLTSFVIGVSFITGIYVSGLDFGFKELLGVILR